VDILFFLSATEKYYPGKQNIKIPIPEGLLNLASVSPEDKEGYLNRYFHGNKLQLEDCRRLVKKRREEEGRKGGRKEEGGDTEEGRDE
jgi:hypothetical protein